MPIRLRSSSLHRQVGLSLIEVLVATVVLSTGLLGLAGLQIAGMKTTHNSYQMQQATWLVQTLLENIRANRGAALAGKYDVTDCASTGANAVNYKTQTAPACTSGKCTPENLAKDDLFSICSGASASIRNTLINGVLAVACSDPPATGTPPVNPPPSCTVNLQWDERNATKQKDFDGTTDGAETFNITLNAIL
jgi:type IV pilus assembly protein PilV